MKTISEYINESLFNKEGVPYIEFYNGYFGDLMYVYKDVEKETKGFFDIVDPILIKCINVLKSKYKDNIISFPKNLVNHDGLSDGVKFGFDSDESAITAFREISDLFIKDFKKSKLNGDIEIDFRQRGMKHFIEEISFNINDTYSEYMRPTIELATKKSTKR